MTVTLRQPEDLKSDVLLMLCLWWLAAGMVPAQGQAVPQTLLFDIPAQPMGVALLRFSEQARVQLILAVDARALPDSAGVKGYYAPHEALERLIEGASLEFYFTSANTVTVRSLHPAPLATAPPL